MKKPFHIMSQGMFQIFFLIIIILSIGCVGYFWGYNDATLYCNKGLTAIQNTMNQPEECRYNLTLEEFINSEIHASEFGKVCINVGEG